MSAHRRIVDDGQLAAFMADFCRIIDTHPQGARRVRRSATLEHGRRYARIVVATQGQARQAWGFIDLWTGNILSASS